MKFVAPNSKTITANQAAGVVTALVRDAGNTQVASGSATVLGMGPAPTPIFAKLCSNLKLY